MARHYQKGKYPDPILNYHESEAGISTIIAAILSRHLKPVENPFSEEEVLYHHAPYLLMISDTN